MPGASRQQGAQALAGLPSMQAAIGGVFAAFEEIAGHEKINASYVGRILRLTLLTPTSSSCPPKG